MNRESKQPDAVSPNVRSATRLGAESWIAGGRAALIAGGVSAVKIERLAASLRVTTGSFYWHFADRDELLAALVRDWVETNTAGMIAAVQAAGDDPRCQFDAIIRLWVEETAFSPAYDAAMRDWARISKEVELAVRSVDRRRIDLLKEIFLGLGYDPDRAEVRARIMYYHQVGYYALNVKDSLKTRLRLRSHYIEVLRDGFKGP